MYKPYRYKGLLGPIFFAFLAMFPWLAYGQSALLPVTELTVGSYTVQAEVAATENARALGLMHRRALLPDHGMLFVFNESAGHCFWMKNTPLPLSIAFIDDNGIVLNVADMQAHSLDSHCPVSPAQYALEMEQGWFQSHKVGPGSPVKGLP